MKYKGMKYKVMIFSCGFFFPIFFLKEHKLPSMFGGRNLSGVKHRHFPLGRDEGRYAVCVHGAWFSSYPGALRWMSQLCHCCRASWQRLGRG